MAFNRRTMIAGGASLPFAAGAMRENRETAAMTADERSPVKRDAVWRRVMDDKSFEHGRMESGPGLARLSGSVLIAEDEKPLRVDYVVDCDARWRTRRVAVAQIMNGEQAFLTLEHDGEGNWRRNGAPAPGLDGCTDVDLGVSPSTNALPINRLGLKIGESAIIRAAWARFPSLTVEAAEQSYERIGARRYRYRSLASGFEAALDVDEGGSPVEYEGVWRRIAAGPAAPAHSFLPAVHSGFAGALVAAGPSPELGAAAKDFDWLAGGWTAEVVDIGPDGTVREGRGEWWFAWVLEGRALQDVWIVPPRGRRDKPYPDHYAGDRYGSTIRYFDRRDGQWRISWFNPVTGAVNHLAGAREGDRIELLGESNGAPIRWSFNDITPESCLWRGEFQAPTGEWITQATFKLKRM